MNYDLIKELLSDESQQIFYYKRVLWQFLVDNHQLSCAQSSFCRYISKHAEFQEYFESKRKKQITKKPHMRFETAPGKQAQLDWKKSMNSFKSKIPHILRFICCWFRWNLGYVVWLTFKKLFKRESVASENITIKEPIVLICLAFFGEFFLYNWRFFAKLFYN